MLDRIPPGRQVSIERDTFPTIVAGGRLFALATDDYWIDTGRPELYLQANLDLLDGAATHACRRRRTRRRRRSPTATVARSLDRPGRDGRRRRDGHAVGAARRGRRRAAVRSWSSSIVMGRVGPAAPVARLGDRRRRPTCADGERTSRRRDRPDLTSCRTTRRATIREVLVIGGAGFIGSHLVDRLLAEGISVDVVDDLSTRSLANLADARAGRSAASCRSTRSTRAPARPGSLISMRRPDVIFHLALLPPGRRRSTAHAAARSRRCSRVLEAARQHGVTKVVVAAAGDGAVRRMPPARELPVKEGRRSCPRGVRGVVAKAIVDLLDRVPRAARESSSPRSALATVYGPRQRPDGGVVARVRAHAAGTRRRRTSHGDGRQTRDFVFVDDVVDALVRAGQRGSGLVVNVGTGVQTSLRDLWTLIAARRRRSRSSARRAPTSCCASRCRRCGRGSTWPGHRGPTLAVRAALSCAEGRRASQRARVARASSAAISGVDITDGVTTSASRPPRPPSARSASTGSITSVAGDRRVQPGDADDRRLVAELGEHPVGRALQRCTADDRRHGDHRFAPRGEQLVDAGRARIGPIDTIGFDGAITTHVGRRRVAAHAGAVSAAPSMRRTGRRAPATPWCRRTK